MNRQAILSIFTALILWVGLASMDTCWAKKGHAKNGSQAGASQQATSDHAGESSEPGAAAGGEGEGVDATVVQGVNTAGTVRVNNLANLEALLNIIANLCEIVGLMLAGPMMLGGFILLFIKGKRLLGVGIWWLGLFIGIFAIALPGIINWLVASARDANLFS